MGQAGHLRGYLGDVIAAGDGHLPRRQGSTQQELLLVWLRASFSGKLLLHLLSRERDEQGLGTLHLPICSHCAPPLGTLFVPTHPHPVPALS